MEKLKQLVIAGAMTMLKDTKKENPPMWRVLLYMITVLLKPKPKAGLNRIVQ